MKIINSLIKTPAAHPLPALLVHDLRTPLSQIIGYSELMIEQAEEGSCPEMLPHLEKIRTAGYRLLELMDTNFQAIPTPGIEELTALLKVSAT
jgi:signal transduction histidine kinase